MSLSVRQLSKSFGERRILRDIDLELEAGEFTVMLGSSGAGKSTFLRCINGLIRPDRGEIAVDGELVTTANLRRIRRKVGFVFQNFNVIGSLSVLHNVLLGHLAAKPTLGLLFSPSERRAAIEALELVGLADHLHMRADRLSGGQKQRVGIARVVVQNPKVILADEPVSNLDPVISVEILQLLRRINAEKRTTVLCNLHQLEYARAFGNRIIGLREGRITFDGTADELESHLDGIYGRQQDRIQAAAPAASSDHRELLPIHS